MQEEFIKVNKIKITYKEIADFIGKGEQSIKYHKSENHEHFEILRNGALLKKYNCDNIEDIEELIEIKKSLESANISGEQLIGLLEAVKACKSD